MVSDSYVPKVQHFADKEDPVRGVVGWRIPEQKPDETDALTWGSLTVWLSMNYPTVNWRVTSDKGLFFTNGNGEFYLMPGDYIMDTYNGLFGMDAASFEARFDPVGARRQAPMHVRDIQVIDEVEDVVDDPIIAIREAFEDLLPSMGARRDVERLQRVSDETDSDYCHKKTQLRWEWFQAGWNARLPNDAED